MELNEILNKVAELKELAAKTEQLAKVLQSEVTAKADEAREAIFDSLIAEKVDKDEYKKLVQESSLLDSIKYRIDAATFKLTREVIGNLDIVLE